MKRRTKIITLSSAVFASGVLAVMAFASSGRVVDRYWIWMEGEDGVAFRRVDGAAIDLEAQRHPCVEGLLDDFRTPRDVVSLPTRSFHTARGQRSQ